MAKKSGAIVRELRVVFDTNPLHTQAPHELINTEARKLIETNSAHPDLKISWYVPEVVVNERHYQMREEAEQLLPAFRKINAILGIDISVASDQLSPRINTVIEAALTQLSVTKLQLNASAVDWPKILHNSAFRVPPFQELMSNLVYERDQAAALPS